MWAALQHRLSVLSVRFLLWVLASLARQRELRRRRLYLLRAQLSLAAPRSRLRAVKPIQLDQLLVIHLVVRRHLCVLPVLLRRLRKTRLLGVPWVLAESVQRLHLVARVTLSLLGWEWLRDHPSRLTLVLLAWVTVEDRVERVGQIQVGRVRLAVARLACVPLMSAEIHIRPACRQIQIRLSILVHRARRLHERQLLLRMLRCSGSRLCDRHGLRPHRTKQTTGVTDVFVMS